MYVTCSFVLRLMVRLTEVREVTHISAYLLGLLDTQVLFVFIVVSPVR